jgi:WD40 repeat protein
MRCSRSLLAIGVAAAACGRGVSLDAGQSGGARRLSGLWSACGRLGTGAPVRLARSGTLETDAILYAEGMIAVQRSGDHSLVTVIPDAGGNELALSADGARVATAGDGRLAVWRTGDGVLLFEKPGAYRRVVFSPDVQTLLAVTAGRMVERRRADDGSLVDSFGPFAGPVIEPAFSTDASGIVTGVRVYDSASAAVTSYASATTVVPVDVVDAGARVTDALISPNGSTLALVTLAPPLFVGQPPYAIDMYDAAAGQVLWSYESLDAAPVIAFSTDSQALAASTGSRLLGVYIDRRLPFLTDSTGLVPEIVLDQVTSLAVDEGSLLLGDRNGVYSIPRADPSRRARVSALPGQGLTIMAAAFSPDGKWLATAGFPEVIGFEPPVRHPGDVTLWDRSARGAHRTFHDVDATSLSFSPDSQRLLVGGNGDVPNLREYPLGVGDPIGRGADVWLSGYGPQDGTALVSGSAGINVVDMVASSADRALLSRTAFAGFALSPDRRFIATTGPALWRADDLGLIWPASAPVARPLTPDDLRDDWVTFSPSGASILTSDFTSMANLPWRYGDDATQAPYATVTRLLGASDGAVIRDFGPGVARRPAFSPDGRWIVAGNRVYAVEGDAIVDLPLAAGFAAVSAFAPDGTIAVGREDGVIELFCPM